MKKLIPLAILSVVIMTGPAFADDTPQGVASDVGAVQKDNQALSKDNAKLAKHRAQKAKDKAEGNSGSQAVDSLSVGADKAGRSEKETEKSYDKKTLNNDVNDSVDK